MERRSSRDGSRWTREGVGRIVNGSVMEPVLKSFALLINDLAEARSSVTIDRSRAMCNWLS